MLRSRPGTRSAAGFDNYRRLFEDGEFLGALKISLMVTLATVVVALVFAFLAAVALSRFRFRGRKSFVFVLLLVQMIPAEGLFISQYKMLDGADLTNTVGGLTLLYVAAVLPFTIWTLRGFVAGLPIELEEAAMVDGCSRIGAFFRITFPLLAPGLVATGVFGFIQAWNEFTLALVVMTREDRQTLPVWLQHVLRRQPGHRLGRGHGRLDADRRAGHHLLPDRPGPDGRGTDRWCGEGMNTQRMRVDQLALAVQLPGLSGPDLDAETWPSCWPRGWAGSACSGPPPPVVSRRSVGSSTRSTRPDPAPWSPPTRRAAT